MAKCLSSRNAAVWQLVNLLTPLLGERPSASAAAVAAAAPSVTPSTPSYQEILAAIQGVTRTLIPGTPLSTVFHDGQVHDPLGGGAYAFQNDIVAPVLSALRADEELSSPSPITTTIAEVNDIGSSSTNSSSSSNGNNNNNSSNSSNSSSNYNYDLPRRPIIIHAGLQPNNSPHMGTLVVFCYAFAFARAVRDRMEAVIEGNNNMTPTVGKMTSTLPPVSVLITFVDTAPVKDQGFEVNGIQYQRSHRDVSEALDAHMGDYQEVLHFLSTWSGIPFSTAFQSDLFSSPAMPSLVQYMVSQRETLGPQLSPKYGSLALRSACPILGCGLAEKHGRLNQYKYSGRSGDENGGGKYGGGDGDGDDDDGGTITFHCPNHGPHEIRLSRPVEVGRLEANAPTRNLLRSMTHLLDTTTHHVRVTGADYAGMYQETFLYRPLAAWSAKTGLAKGRTPHILYAPLVVDWSGAKLSKSLYVRQGAYGFLKQLGMDMFCSYAQLRERFDTDDDEAAKGLGLRKIWDEVQRWVADPKKLFRAFSLAYLQDVMEKEDDY